MLMIMLMMVLNFGFDVDDVHSVVDGNIDVGAGLVVNMCAYVDFDV